MCVSRVVTVEWVWHSMAYTHCNKVSGPKVTNLSEDALVFARKDFAKWPFFVFFRLCALKEEMRVHYHFLLPPSWKAKSVTSSSISKYYVKWMSGKQSMHYTTRKAQWMLMTCTEFCWRSKSEVRKWQWLEMKALLLHCSQNMLGLIPTVSIFIFVIHPTNRDRTALSPSPKLAEGLIHRQDMVILLLKHI